MSFFSSTPSWWPRAQAQGLVGGTQPAAVGDEEPSAFVIGLALLGASVCALAAGAFLLALLDSDFWLRNPAAYVVNGLGLVGAAVLLRRARRVFVTCLALVLWGLFCGLFLARLDYDVNGMDLGFWLFTGLLALLQLLAAAVAHALWVRRMLGLVFGVAAYLFLQRCVASVPLLLVLDVASLVLVAAWWLWLRQERQHLARGKALGSYMGWAVFADSAAEGVLAMVFVAVAFVGVAGAGWSYGLFHDLQGVALDDAVSESLWRSMVLVGRGFASVCVLVATALLWAHWKKYQMATPYTLRTLLGLGVLLSFAAWFSPSLGVVALLAATALTGGRWRIAVLCGVLALWALGRFYYSLAWPLAQKGLGLAAMGAVLLLGLYAQRALAARQATASRGAAPDGLLPVAAWSRARLLCLVAGAALVFGLVNWDVRGKEKLIAEGQPVLVRLIPVDPRSLMQGDYMALNFSLPPEVSAALLETLAPTALVRAKLDDKGEATVLALARSRADAGAGEIILPLKQLKGRWVLVTDAYFFPEGTGDAFARAQYGDFRVLPDGRALLVGLADAQGKSIAVPRASAMPMSRNGVGGSSGRAEEATEVQAVQELAPVAEPTTTEAAAAAATGVTEVHAPPEQAPRPARR